MRADYRHRRSEFRKQKSGELVWAGRRLAFEGLQQQQIDSIVNSNVINII